MKNKFFEKFFKNNKKNPNYPNYEKNTSPSNLKPDDLYSHLEEKALDNEELHYLNINEKIDISEEKLHTKTYFAWKIKKNIAIILSWFLIIITFSSLILGLGYSKNHRLINFGYDFAGTTEFAIPNMADIQDFSKNYGLAEADAPTVATNLYKYYKLTDNTTFKAKIGIIHNEINNYCKNNHLLYKDNWNSIDTSWTNPYAFGLNSQTNIASFIPTKDNSPSDIQFYFVKINVGIYSDKTKLRDKLKLTEVAKLNELFFNLYKTNFTSLYSSSAPGHTLNPSDQGLSKYLPNWTSLQTDLTSTYQNFTKTWISRNQNDFYFYWQVKAPGVGIEKQLVTLVLSFVIVSLIGIIYLNIRYKTGNALAILASTLGYVLTVTALLLPSTLVISQASIVIIFFVFILMFINFLGIYPNFMRYRKMNLELNYQANRTTPKQIYAIIRQIMSKRKLYFITQFLIIFIPLIIYSLTIIIIDAINHVPFWITITFHLSDEIYSMICYLIMWFFFLFIFIPIWAWSQSRSINFWREYNYSAITKKEAVEEQNFNNINEIHESKYEKFRQEGNQPDDDLINDQLLIDE